MSDVSSPLRVLHLIIEGFPADQAEALSQPSSDPTRVVEIASLNEGNAGEVLEKIFAADSVAVWGPLS